MEVKDKDDVFVVFQFTPETVEELRAAFKAGGEVKVREVLTRVRPGMTEEEIVAVVRGLEEEANAAQAAAVQPSAEPKSVAPAPTTPAGQPEGFDPFFGGPDPFRITQEMAPVREPEPAAPKPAEPTTPVAAPADDPDDDEEEPEDIPPEDVRVEPDPPPHPEEGRGKKVLPLVLIVLLALAIVIVLAVRFCGGQEEPAATAPEEPTPTETVLVIDQEQAIAACEARFQGYLTHDECVKAVQR